MRCHSACYLYTSTQPEDSADYNLSFLITIELSSLVSIELIQGVCSYRLR